MSRPKKSKIMRKYFGSRMNCENVMGYISENKSSNDTIKVNDEEVSFDIFDYDYGKDVDKMTKILDRIDIMTDANESSAEIFPYIYGVLDCNLGANSKLYVLYEPFVGTFRDIHMEVGQSSEWYDITLQIILITEYFKEIMKIGCFADLDHILWNRMAKPYYHPYLLDDESVPILRHFDIVVSRFPTDCDNKVPTIELYHKYVTDLSNFQNTANPPTPRIAEILSIIINNKQDVKSVIDKYFVRKNN